MKCVIALAILAVALPAAFGAPRPGYLTGPTLLTSGVALAPSAYSSQSTVTVHQAPTLTYARAGPLAAAYSLPVVAAAPAPSLLPVGKTTVVAGPSGTITETQGYGALAYSAW